jgi:hypothetical protein
MTDDPRNPYLVLGVPYGTSRAEATRAFAERSKRARRDAASPYSIEDLTWALQQVEANLDDPINSVDHFRVPDDVDAPRDPTGPGLLRLSTTPLSRRAHSSTPSAMAVPRDPVILVPDRVRAVPDPRPIPVHPGSADEFQFDDAPVGRRARWPILVVLAVLVGGFGVAVVVSSGQDSDAVVAAPTSLAPATTETTVAPTTSTTIVEESPPAVGDRIEINGLVLTTFNPIDAYGLLCVLFAVVGDPPLVFLPEFAIVTMADGAVVQPALDITTGRAAIGPVFDDPSPQQREVCWPAEGWATSDLTISYEYDGRSFEWVRSAT